MATKTPTEYSSLSEKQIDRIEAYIGTCTVLILSGIFAVGFVLAMNIGDYFMGAVAMAAAVGFLIMAFAELRDGASRRVMDTVYRRLSPGDNTYYSELSGGESDR